MSSWVLSVWILAACSHPKIQLQQDITPQRARLTPDSVVMTDAYVLPMKTWSAADAPTAVVIAMHGFNDYSNAFDATAQHFAGEQITTYAIDQRGFGATEQNGVWAGAVTMQADLIATINLLCEKHAGLPLFVLGESMGGAVVLSALQQLQATCIQGVILMAPAVWGWQVMPWWQTMPLRLLAHTVPETTVTGEGMEIQPSDNREMLQALGLDPLIIKETRIDAIYGLTDLMQAALDNSKVLKMPALILYGAHDDIIPPESFCEMLKQLPEQAKAHWRLIYYPNGYHMLSRDLQGKVVMLDMVKWMREQSTLFPSGWNVYEGQDKPEFSLPVVCDG